MPSGGMASFGSEWGGKKEGERGESHLTLRLFFFVCPFSCVAFFGVIRILQSTLLRQLMPSANAISRHSLCVKEDSLSSYLPKNEPRTVSQSFSHSRHHLSNFIKGPEMYKITVQRSLDHQRLVAGLLTGHCGHLSSSLTLVSRQFPLLLQSLQQLHPLLLPSGGVRGGPVGRPRSRRGEGRGLAEPWVDVGVGAFHEFQSQSSNI